MVLVWQSTNLVELRLDILECEVYSEESWSTESFLR